MLGPSLKWGSKPFHARFGSDDDLTQLQDMILAEGEYGAYRAVREWKSGQYQGQGSPEKTP